MIALVNTTWDIRESVLFQQVLKTYPTHHFWMITAHVSLGDMEKQWKLFTKQMIRTHQLLPSLEQKPAAPTQLLTGLEAELRNLNIIYTSCQHIIQAATQLLWKEPTFDEIPVSTKHIKITLLSFLGDALSWLTGTATTKDVDAIKTRINQLISTQQKQQEIPVHIISILNFTIHATQVNRHHINILMYMTEKTQQDITTLANTAQYHMFPLQQHQLPSDPSWPTSRIPYTIWQKLPFTPWTLSMQLLQEYSWCTSYLSEIWRRYWSKLRKHCLLWCTCPFPLRTLYISTDIYALVS